MVTSKQYKPGGLIIKENDPGETAYIIKNGRVRVTKEVEGESIHICDLETGNIFGEMSMIDDKPRSATVIAIEETVVQEFHRDKFYLALKNEQQLSLKILKVLFERLRKSNAMISKIMAESPNTKDKPYTPECDISPKANAEILLEGMTRQAGKSLPENPYHIKEFPFLIGRKSRDPLAFNDLSIPDKKPYRISRHHIELDRYEDGVIAVDRGSNLGSIINDRQLGGLKEVLFP